MKNTLKKMRIIKLRTLFVSASLLIIIWHVAGCSEKRSIQNIDGNKFDLTKCKWVVDSLTLAEPSMNLEEKQLATKARITNLFLNELYEAKDDVIYFEFKKNGRAFFSFVDSAMQVNFNLSYKQSDKQIIFTLKDTASSQVLDFSVDYFFSPNKDFPQLLFNDSDFVLFYLTQLANFTPKNT
jgi:hypothetical protein